MAQNGPRMTQNDPKWPKNDPKWPKNDARIYALFPQFFFTEKAVPQFFSLLECMTMLWSNGHGVFAEADRKGLVAS